MGMLDAIKCVEKMDLMAEIELNFEFNIVLLGDPGVGKTSLVQKVINNYNDVRSMDDSISSIGQEITKHLLFANTADEIKATFVSTLLQSYASYIYDSFSLTPRVTMSEALWTNSIEINTLLL